jgi:hypothetical protein
MPIEIVRLIDDARLLLGVCEVEGGTVRDSGPGLRAVADALALRIGQLEWEIPEERRRSIRTLMKLGGFSATGRNRPAHELLINDLKERGGFHYINNIADANNVVSLESLLPISVFDCARLAGRLWVRVGREGEGYVFNQSGQWLDVKRCICCCAGEEPDGVPVGTPVKDSMATKIFPGAAHFLGVIYASAELWSREEVLAHTQRFAELMASESGGRVTRVDVC